MTRPAPLRTASRATSTPPTRASSSSSKSWTGARPSSARPPARSASFSPVAVAGPSRPASRRQTGRGPDGALRRAPRPGLRRGRLRPQPHARRQAGRPLRGRDVAVRPPLRLAPPLRVVVVARARAVADLRAAGRVTSHERDPGARDLVRRSCARWRIHQRRYVAPDYEPARERPRTSSVGAVGGARKERLVPRRSFAVPERVGPAARPHALRRDSTAPSSRGRSSVPRGLRARRLDAAAAFFCSVSAADSALRRPGQRARARRGCASTMDRRGRATRRRQQRAPSISASCMPMLLHPRWALSARSGRATHACQQSPRAGRTCRHSAGEGRRPVSSGSPLAVLRRRRFIVARRFFFLPPLLIASQGPKRIS